MRGTSSVYRLTFAFFNRLWYTRDVDARSGSRCPRHRESQVIVTSRSVVLNRSGDVTRTEVDDVLLERQAQEATDSESGSCVSCDSAHPVMQTLALVHGMADLLSRRKTGFSNKTCSEVENCCDWTSVSAQEQRRRTNVVTQVLSQGRRVFEAESRVARICSPCLVFGDTHGNLWDLLSYQRLVWQRHPLLTQTCVFLGDYVDRGLQAVEVFLFLLCLKLVSPESVVLLRGNHETREMHAQFTFRAEVLSKFRDNGRDMYDRFCAVMDCMPVAGLIDERLFCAHGGIPATVTRIRNLRTMPSCLSHVEDECLAAWHILWNDPLDEEEMRELRQAMGSESGSSSGGFFFNVKRGTGYVFGEQAVDRFNCVNDTSHVIRAHELVMNGWRLHFGGKTITVFSSSAYTGESNTPACILVQDQTLTPVQFLTLYPDDQ